MSIRAYRINKIDHESSRTINLWHDEKLVEFLEHNYDLYRGLNEDCCGITELPIEALKEAIKKAEELELDEVTIEALYNDIMYAESNNEDYVKYYCY